MRSSGIPRPCFTRIPGLFNGDVSLAPLVLLLGFGISLSFFLFGIQRDNADAQLQFRLQARDYVSSIANRVTENNTTVEAVAALVNASDHVDRDEFRIFTQPFLDQNPSIQALQWIQYSKDSEREKFEALAQADGLTDFHFKDLDSIETSDPSPQRDDYYVIYYNEPAEPNHLVTGLDNGSDTGRKEALLGAVKRGCATSSSPITVPQENEGSRAYLVYVPVYTTPTIKEGVTPVRSDLAGFAAGVFRVDSLLSSVLGEKQREMVHLSITDITNTAEPLPVGTTKICHCW